MSLRIVTRKSPLALWQAERVCELLRSALGGRAVEIIGVTTEADRFLDRSLASMGGKGLFVKELEQALLEGRADIAVHSMKDVPVDLPPGLALGAILQRDDPRDVIVSRDGRTLDELPSGSCIGTASLRRRSQVLHRRPDLVVADLRGNVGTRIAKLDRGEFDALLLAAAGMKRLGHADRITQYLPVEIMLPAIGQGAIGVETRSGDREVNTLVATLHDPGSAQCVRAERALSRRLYGSCRLPIAGHARIDGGRLKLEALVAGLDGRRIVRDATVGDPEQAETLGEALAASLLEQGADEILKEVAGERDD